MSGPVLFAEPGASWWPVLWGPAFAAAGLGVELVTSGPLQPQLWLPIGLLFAVAGVLWARGRRRICSVQLTADTLRCGQDELAVARIAAVDGVQAPPGSPVLGRAWGLPKGTTAVPVRLDDESVVITWARDADTLRDALHRVSQKPT